MRRLLHLACVLLIGGCAVGAPLGFSKGDLWSFPLIGPLEDGQLVVPVKVNGKGPYPFLIDPDAPMSSVDNQIANTLELYVVRGPELLDESDTLQPTVIAETGKLEIGELTVSNLKVHVHPMQRLWVGGREIRGILGRDIFSNAMIVGVDRERGLVHLATQGHMPPPAGAIEVRGKRLFAHMVVEAQINRDKKVALAVDLNAPATMLWPSVISAAKLPERRVQAVLVDELAMPRKVSAGALAAKISVGAAEGDAQLVLPYGDKRRREVDLDGALGANFLANFRVTINFDKSVMWLVPRSGDDAALAAERIHRWGNRFDACASRACVKIALAGEEGARHIEITREPSALGIEYEILFEALDAEGKSLGLPRLRASLPAGVATIVDPGGDDFGAAASFRVLDVSPFARPCEGVGAGQRCVWAIVPLR